MTTKRVFFIAAGGAAVTFALIWFAIQLVSKPPSGLGLLPFYLLLPAELLGETLASRAAFLVTGFLEFLLIYLLGLLGWEWTRARRRA